MSVSAFNRRWAQVILTALQRQGVRHVCIAPGSRSTPLTLEAAGQPDFICHTHFDERGLGHLALGLAKASSTPVAVIVTSGTAVANLYPALIEAGLTGERLILLTADRPPELIDCGANQAIRQPDIFASHPQRRLALPRPTPDIPARWLASAVDEALGTLRYGGLHINCPFPEPLYQAWDDEEQAWSAALGDWWQAETPWLSWSQPQTVHTEADWATWAGKRVVVIAGKLSAEEGPLLARWAAQAGWPLLADVLSQTGQPLPHADLWLSSPTARRVLAQAERVIQFGGWLTGKRLLQWQAQCDPQHYWLIDPAPGRRDPAHHRGRRICASCAEWLRLHPAPPGAPWATELAALPRAAAARIQQTLPATLSEAWLAAALPELLPEGGQLFLGNSLSIRLADALAQLPAGYPVWGNRGASGIDGLIGTLAGVTRAQPRPTLAIIGDLSSLYDLNSLALLRQTAVPVALIIINNGGGQIFSMLPTPPTLRERYYLMPQQAEFRHAAALFGLAYQQPGSQAELRAVLAESWRREATTLIELKVDSTAGARILPDLVSQLEAL